MKLPEKKLDNIDYDGFIGIAKSLVMQQFPGWTDFNASDPGMTLIELFSFVMDCTIYQINCVQERTIKNFAILLGITPDGGDSAEDALKRAVEALGHRNRAITAQDYEALAAGYENEGKKLVKRAKAFQNENGRVKVAMLIAADNAQRQDSVCEEVYKSLKWRSLLTAGLSVVQAKRKSVKMEIYSIVSREKYITGDTVTGKMLNAVKKYLDPETGGIDGKGWQFGRSLYRSELYYILGEIEGIDHIQALKLNGSETDSEVKLDMDNDYYFFEIKDESKDFAVNVKV